MHNVIVLIGESGSGKSLAVNILEDYYGYKIIRTHTTRKIRPDDDKIPGTYEDYLIEKENDTALAYTFYNGNHYWTSKNDIDFSEDVSFVILDKKGINDFKKNNNFKVHVIKIYAHQEIRARRMIAQKRDIDEINNRIKNDEIDFANIEYDYLINNIGPVDVMVKKIVKITNSIKEIESGKR